MSTRARIGWLVRAGLGGVAIAALAACSAPLSRVDRATDRLLEERSQGIGTVSPRPARSLPDPADRRSLTRTDPPTVNPRTDELRLIPADEDRDVAELLTRYAERAIGGAGGDVRRIGLSDALRIAQESGREYRNAEEAYILSAIALLIERHLWGPRLFNDTSVFVGAEGDEGRFDHELDVINTLRVTQRLPYGGDIEARWVARATDQLRDNVTQRSRRSSELVLRAAVPLLRGAGTVAREDLIQSERNLVYAARSFERFRRFFLDNIAGEFFALVESRNRIANRERQLASRIRADLEAQAKVEAGRLRPFQRDITANAVEETRAALAADREGYILQLERFKIRLGLEPETPIEIMDPDFDVPEPALTPQEATLLALEYRLDLQNERDGLIDRERAVRNARNDLLPDFDITGSIGFETDDDENNGGFGLDDDELDYSLGMTFGLPLDRRIERLRVRRSLIQRDQAERDFTEFRDRIVVSARAAVRSVDLARFQLDLAERQIEINERGLEDLRLRDDSDPQAIVDRENALLDAENARDSALTDLRNAVLDYLLETGQLRVQEDGTFDPPPGLLDG